jgi:uncharacterized protein YrrD
MLRSVRDLLHYKLHALDGEIGRIEDFLFDDQGWHIRYLVVNTGNWLIRNSVLISPVAIQGIRWDSQTLDVSLTREQIENSPDLDAHPPVSRVKEAQYFDYYRWPYYWSGVGIWGTSALSHELPETSATPRTFAPGGAKARDRADTHLKSTHEVRGYHIAASDMEFGHVEDFILDDEEWKIRYFVIDTRNWWPAPWVLMACDWIGSIRWDLKQIQVSLPHDRICAAPEYDRSVPVTRSYEARLYEYYGRTPYWVSDADHMTKGTMASAVK